MKYHFKNVARNRALLALATTASATTAMADDRSQDGTPLLETSFSVGFAPPLYQGFKRCVITDRAVVKTTGSALFTIKEVLPLTRLDQNLFRSALEEARQEGLTNLGPAPVDIPYAATLAYLPDGSRLLLNGIQDGNFVENQSLAAKGLVRVLTQHCGSLK